MINDVAIAAMRAREEARFIAANPKSKAAVSTGWFQGVPFHWMLDWPSPFPLVAAHASGATLTTVDGNILDDFCLGDTGSMLLGFLIGWFAIDLTQGVDRSFPPICALWITVLPLCDCVSLMIRRKREGRGMLVADRQHFHHYLLNRGFSVGRATLVSFTLNAACAGLALAAWQLKFPEPAMFTGFVVLFVFYHVHMTRAFKSAPPLSNFAVASSSVSNQDK